MNESFYGGSEYVPELSRLAIEPEIWAILPVLEDWIGGHYKYFGSGSRLRDQLGRVFPLIRKSLCNVELSEEGTFFVWTTENQRRSFGRLIDDPSVGKIDSQRGRHGRLVRSLQTDHFFNVARRNRRLIRKLTSALGIHDPAVQFQLDRLVGLATLEIHVTQRVMAHRTPQRLVVATQHSVPVRAALVAAREAGVPTVYVPHAPVASNRAYRDLPFDFAALRGPLEVDYYAELGADRRRLHVVGDLGLSVPADSSPCPDGPVLVAPSPWEPPRVEQFIETVSAGIDEPFLVCPHPRTDIAHMRRLLPERAHLVEAERTADVIARGCRAVVQNSSGVAVEAMLLGAPVVEVPADGQPPSYRAIAEPYVTVATTPAELRQAITTLGSSTRLRHVEQARVWVRGWTAHTGSEAEDRLRELLGSALQPSGALRDEWSPSVT